MSATKTDVAIIGAGLVGLATAYRLQEMRPDAKIVVLEKESAPATHQSGRNSGVLHAGLYYKPGSQKARLCRAGKVEMEAFCEAEGIALSRSGKVVVAVTPEELPRLDVLAERAAANGVVVERLGPDGIREHEPYAAGLAGLWVAETAVTDFKSAANRLAELIRERGAEVRVGAAVLSGNEGSTSVQIETTSGAIEAKTVVNCAGLWADRIATLFGVDPGVQLVPFRGDYAMLTPHAAEMVRGLIYPVPDPSFPFLGVHLTRRFDGSVDAGPSATLAFAREGYTLGTVRPGELLETFRSSGFRRLAIKHWRMGAAELDRSLRLTSFWKAARRLVPDLQLSDLTRGPSGVRAQAIYPDGSLADDFVIRETARAVHVINAPSPAATASLAIGREIADLAATRLG